MFQPLAFSAAWISSISLAVSSGSVPSVMFTPFAKFSALKAVHSAYSGGSSWSGQIALMGQAGTHASQSMHVPGSITSIAGDLISQKHVTGHSTTQYV